jgi:hypothetical protein
MGARQGAVLAVRRALAFPAFRPGDQPAAGSSLHDGDSGPRATISSDTRECVSGAGRRCPPCAGRGCGAVARSRDLVGGCPRGSGPDPGPAATRRRPRALSSSCGSTGIAITPSDGFWRRPATRQDAPSRRTRSIPRRDCCTRTGGSQEPASGRPTHKARKVRIRSLRGMTAHPVGGGDRIRGRLGAGSAPSTSSTCTSCMNRDTLQSPASSRAAASAAARSSSVSR